MYLIMVNDKDGVLKELCSVVIDLAKCREHFLAACSTYISNWNEYSADDIQDCWDEGFVEFGGGAVMIVDTCNTITDAEIADKILGVPDESVKVARVLSSGELDLEEGMSLDDIMNQCSGNLDDACSWDIQGQVLFQGTDGEYYVVTTETSIGRANPAFVEETLAELADQDEVEDEVA